MKREILRVDNITTSRMSSVYLDHFQMTVYEGEITGITGLADSGLSCIADVLSGRSGIEQGCIYLANQKVEIQSLEIARHFGIHVISEKPVLFEHLTLEENICISERDFFSSINFPSQKQIKKIRRCMEELECFLDLKKSAMALTVAEKYILEMLRTYYNGGKLVLLNHIVGNCSEKECEQLLELILRLKERGVGIVILDTNIDRIKIISDTVLVMRGGRVEGICQGDSVSKIEVEHILMGDYSIPDTCKKTFNFDMKKGRPLLEFRSVTTEKIEAFEFQMNKGEVWGIGGEKKDLYFPFYQLFCGNVVLRQGSARLDGKTISVWRGREAMIRQGFGFVEEYHQGIFPRLSLMENLTLTSLSRMTSGLSINHRLEWVVANDMAEELGIPLKDLRKPIEKTSANTRFLITIYRWFLRNSKVLVFHNVLANSDIIMRDSILQVINRIHESDMGLIIFSSNKKELYELCDHVVYLTEGERQ